MFQSDEDLPFEEDVLRNPFSVRHWLRYIDHKKEDSDAVHMLYERALKGMPGSYKLWIRYLRHRVKQTKGCPVSDPVYRDTNNCFERALVFMHKMPRIWIEYVALLMDECLITQTRRAFDRALQALPITQHTRIWPLYLKFIQMHDIPETAIRVYNRYLKLQPEDAENFVDYLKRAGRLDEAAVKLADIVNDERFLSREGKSKYQLWSELCELVSRNPEDIKSLNVEAIIREGVRRYTDQQGRLWNALAEFFTRSGLFEKVRDVYEEGMQHVTTIRDFSQVFDAYAQSEERMINALIESDLPDEIELELRMARYENLIERRPLLLNSVSLRQNPHNVDEWLKRISLLEGKPVEVISTFLNAVHTVDAKQAIGKLCSLWIEFAKFYEINGQVSDARLVFEKGTEASFVKVDDLANIWCEYAEMELRNHNPKAALRIMERATATPKKKAGFYDTSEPVQNRVFRSLKLWSLYADLEESFGTFKSTKAVYDRIIDLRIATPQIIINYGMYLEEQKYFEEAFRAYEKGIDLFRFPLVYDIWNMYLTKFLERYGGSKLERARDLFEQCLSSCPPEFAKGFYLLYAKLEEDHGLAKHAMSIYDRAVSAVDKVDQLDMFNVYIRKAGEMFGITHTRAIYEKAVECLPEDDAREMCQRFADLERKLGEIDRARAIYAHCSQMCDPRTTANFWNAWREFEIKHGNEDTIREMLRIKRSVQATYNTQVNFMASSFVAASTNDSMKALDEEVGNDQDNDEAADVLMQAAEVTVPAVSGAKEVRFIRSTASAGDGEKALNPDEIDLDEEQDEEQDDEEESAESGDRGRDVRVQQKAVPKEVFGGLASAADGHEEESHS